MRALQQRRQQVQVVRSIDGETATANVTVLVNAPSGTFSGMLDPASDTGVSNTDGITSINQPTFRGTATPYAIVQLLARPQGQSDLVSLGQTVADPSGQWSLTVGPMLDGVYSIFANVAPPQGFPIQVVPLSPNNQIVIDTVGPSVVSVVPDPRHHQILVSFQDKLSGLDLSTLTNPANYTLIGPHPRRVAPLTVSLVPSAAVLTNDPQMVVINTNSPFPVRGLRIVPGGIRDIAGNPLNGLFNGRFPSGGHPQGSSFIYYFPNGIPQANSVPQTVGSSTHSAHDPGPPIRSPAGAIDQGEAEHALRVLINHAVLSIGAIPQAGFFRTFPAERARLQLKLCFPLPSGSNSRRSRFDIPIFWSGHSDIQGGYVRCERKHIAVFFRRASMGSNWRIVLS